MSSQSGANIKARINAKPQNHLKPMSHNRQGRGVLC